MKARLVLSWNKYSDAEFETKANHILGSMTGNPHFPEPMPLVADVKTAAEKYSIDLAASKALGRTLVAQKKASRQQLENALTKLGHSIMTEFHDDRLVLVTTGFSLKKNPEPGTITNPGSVTLTSGLNSGEIVCTVKKPKAATGFMHQITGELADENTAWESTATSTNKNVFKNLTPGKQYWVRVAAVGSKGQIAFSPVATTFSL